MWALPYGHWYRCKLLRNYWHVSIHRNWDIYYFLSKTYPLYADHFRFQRRHKQRIPHLKVKCTLTKCSFLSSSLKKLEISFSRIWEKYLKKTSPLWKNQIEKCKSISTQDHGVDSSKYEWTLNRLVVQRQRKLFSVGQFNEWNIVFSFFFFLGTWNVSFYPFIPSLCLFV